MLRNIFVACVITVAPIAAQAQEQPICGKYSEFASNLENTGWDRTFTGITEDRNSIIEVWVNDDGLWGVLVVGSDGGSCLLTSGSMYLGPRPNA